MKVYIIVEHPDGMGGTATDMNDIIIGVFFDQRRAEDFVRGMIGYMNSYENQKLFFGQGKAIDENHTPYFQVVEKDIV